MAKVLFIDDDESIRFLVREELRHDGHSVQVAEDGTAGLRCVLEDRPDLVILDVKMPGMSGLEVLATLKSTDPALPVFLFTAYDDHAAEARRLGADRYFIKSPDLTALKRAVRDTCREPSIPH